MVAAEVLVVIFGKYGVEVGVTFGILWLIAMTPIILRIYREEWKTLSKVYSKEKADRVANNLLVSRYIIGIIPMAASLLGRWSDGNLAILGLLGLLFALIAAKLLTDAEYPLSKEEKTNLLRATMEHNAP
ncbi:translation initiation factor 2 [Thermococcus waiotapuensis]|uniref:translation initiation factor 2 n=1 Tax=Thermococcus waiotapuensis TaxID=90909 RepID=UPI003742163B